MKTAELKKEIQDYIEHADERFLRLVYSMVESEQGEGPANTFFSKTEEDMSTRAKASLKSVEEGRTRDIKEFKKEVVAWKKNQVIK